MRDSTREWWKGATPRQIERQAKVSRHPTRSSLLISLGWFLPMWALTGFTTQPTILIIWIVASLGFGFGLIWYTRRKHTADLLAAKARLTALGESVSDRLTVEQRGWFAEFLRAGELEVGLEMLADWLSEDEHPVSAKERLEATSLAAQFGVSDRIEHVLRGCPAA